MNDQERAVVEAAATLMACPQCSAALQETFENQNGHAWKLRDALARLNAANGLILSFRIPAGEHERFTAEAAASKVGEDFWAWLGDDIHGAGRVLTAEVVDEGLAIELTVLWPESSLDRYRMEMAERTYVLRPYNPTDSEGEGE